jgi:hypothetical protein
MPPGQGYPNDPNEDIYGNSNSYDPYDYYGVYQAYGGADAYNDFWAQNSQYMPQFGYTDDTMAMLQGMGLDPNLFNMHLGRMQHMDPYSSIIAGGQGTVGMDMLQQLYQQGLDPNNPGLQMLFQQVLGIDPAAEQAQQDQFNQYKSVLPKIPKGGYGMSKKALKAMAKSIQDTFANPGMDPEVLANMKNTASSAAKGREKTLLDRHANSMAGRGLFRSGITREGQLDIGSEVSEQLLDALNKIDMQNAQIAESALSRAFQGASSLGSLDMQRMQNMISRGLGLGNLRLQELKINMQRAMQELMANLQIQQYPGIADPTQDTVNSVIYGG